MAPSRSATSSLPARVVNANPFVDCVRTIYGWFRRWLDLGLLDALLRDVARRRRRKGGGGRGPALGLVDTQVTKCVAVRGPRGYDAAKGVVGRERVALVDAGGNWLTVAVVPAFGAGPGRAGSAGRRQGPLADVARGRLRRRVRGRALPRMVEPPRHA